VGKIKFIIFSKMVYFQCESCVQALKKKQLERHYMVECRGANTFSCLTCYKVFDRVSVKDHISCVSEEEKYQKGDSNYNAKKAIKGAQQVKHVAKKDIKPADYIWKGIRKTTRLVLSDSEHHKMEIGKLVEFLAAVYANKEETNVEEVNTVMLRKHILDKLEDHNKFVIDLSKNTIRYKNI
jgi:cell growth-regulating nucleolar protein